MVNLLDLPGEVLAQITDHALKDIRFRSKQRGGHKRNLPKSLSILLVTKKAGLHDIAKQSLLNKGIFTIKSISEFHTFGRSLSFMDASQMAAVRIDLHLGHEIYNIILPRIIPCFTNLRRINVARLYCDCWRSRSVEDVFAPGSRAPGNAWDNHKCSTLEGLVRHHLFQYRPLPSSPTAIAKFNKIQIEIENVLLYCRTSNRHHTQEVQVCHDHPSQFDILLMYFRSWRAASQLVTTFSDSKMSRPMANTKTSSSSRRVCQSPIKMKLVVCSQTPSLREVEPKLE